MIGTAASLISYAAARGQAVVDDAGTTAALVRGSDYVTGRFALAGRALPDPVPEAVEHAAYVAALLEMEVTGFFAKTYTPGERKVLTEVSGIKWTVLPGGDGSAAPVDTRIEALLAPYLRPAPVVGIMTA